MRPQILLAADLGFLNPLAGVTPGRLFQIATRRSVGQPAANCVSSSEVAKGCAPAAITASAWSGAANAGDVVVGVNRKRCHGLISCAVNPRQDMNHSGPEGKQP